MTVHADIEVVEKPGCGGVVPVVDMPLRKRAKISRGISSSTSLQASSAPT